MVRRCVIVGLILLLPGTVIGGLMLDRLTATPVVGFATVGQDPWPLRVDAATARAFVYNRTDGSLSTLDTVTGRVVRTVPAGSQFAFLAIAPRAGHVFVDSGGDDTIYMFDARSGALLHKVADTEPGVRKIGVDDRNAHVFVGHTDSPTVTMLDAHTGQILRHIPVCEGPFALAVSERYEHVFVKCNDGTADMLDARTGRVLRSTPITPGAFGFAVADDPTGRIFLQNDQTAAIDVLDAGTGGRVATVRNVLNVADPAIDTRSGRVYLSLGGPGIPPGTPAQSQVAVLDGRTGRVLRRLAVAANPAAVAVDSATGHLLVGSVGAVNAAGQPTGYGLLSVVNSGSGVELARLPVGIFPGDVEIDPGHNRVLLANRTLDLSGFESGASGPLTTSPPESWWPRTKRQVLHALKNAVPWLPISVPAPPALPTQGTVTTIDLTRL